MSDPPRDTTCVEADGLALEIDIAFAPAGRPDALATVIATAIGAAHRVAGTAQSEVTVIVDNDRRIRALNRQWRGHDKATNVLSFPGPEIQGGPVRHLGDIAIAYATCAREAARAGKSVEDHIAHLAVHGFLHLHGYDHETDDEAAAMEALERRILAQIGVSDPYIARATKG